MIVDCFCDRFAFWKSIHPWESKFISPNQVGVQEPEYSACLLFSGTASGSSYLYVACFTTECDGGDRFDSHKIPK